MEALRLVADWPVRRHAAAVVDARGTTVVGDPGTFRLASLSKPLAAWAVLIAVEEGTVALDTPLDPGIDRVPAGVTLRHLLAHAAGFGFDGDAPIAPPEQRRIYSNTGIERAAEVLARAAGMAFESYLREAVFEPLGMRESRLAGSPAHGVWSTAADVARFLAETMRPRLVSLGTRNEAIRPQYPDLGGIVPGVGRFQPCPWGLGFELHGTKFPHWMGATNSPATYGHFGGAGTMMWVDPAAALGTVALTDRPFDDWAADALRLWPEYSDALLAEARTG